MKNSQLTSNKQSYSEQLQNPKWQLLRLEILKRDKATCKLCGDKETTLHVHHKSYTWGKAPWDYPKNNFITLCKHCHSYVEELKKGGIEVPDPAKTIIVKVISQSGYSICAALSDKDGPFVNMMYVMDGKVATWFSCGPRILKEFMPILKKVAKNG